MKLLLHVCCAPCLIYPLKQLKEKSFEVSVFFYNPNIHPFGEYQKRKQAVDDFGHSAGINIVYPEYVPSEFFWELGHKENKHERCPLCWRLRLKKTADTAKEAGFAYFSTTLLVSPYQDQELLKKTGNAVAGETGVDFYYEDFRPGFKEAHDEAKAKCIYCQKYCGCIYSEVERFKNSARI